MSKPKTPPQPSPAAWIGPPELQPLLVDIGTLSNDANNARQHNARSITAVSSSLVRFGQRKPIVVRRGVVIAGNGTLQAAIKAEWTQIAVVSGDDLTDEQAAAYAIADNRTAELSEWDFEALSTTLSALPAELLTEVGFADFELAPLLIANFAAGDPSQEVDLNQSPSNGKGHAVTFNDAQWSLVQSALTKAKAESRDVSSIPAMIEGVLRRYVTA